MTLFARQYPSEAEAERAYRRRWILIPGVVVLLCVVVGLVSALGPWRTHEAVVSQSYDAGISKIELTNPGDVSIIGVSGTRTLASWETHWNYRKPAVRATRDGDTLRLRLDCSVGVECSADLRLDVPDGVALDVDSVDGDVGANGVGGPVTVDSKSGDVHLADVAGDVDVHELSGDVKLTDIDGNVTAETKSGDVKAYGLDGKTARLSSSSGDVHGDFGAAPERVTAETKSGDVKVAVPRGSGPYQVRADARAGDVHSDVNSSPSATPVIAVSTLSGDIKIGYSDDDGDRHRHEPRPPRPPAPPQAPAPPARPAPPG